MFALRCWLYSVLCLLNLNVRNLSEPGRKKEKRQKNQIKDMVLWLQQPGWSFTWQSVNTTYHHHNTTAVTPLSWLFPFVTPEKQSAACYQGKVHLFRVSCWDGFWASKSQSLFSTLFSFFLLSQLGVCEILLTYTDWTPVISRHASHLTAAQSFPKPLHYFWNSVWGSIGLCWEI